jgi:3-dehydroquinate dehydratase/shikimate dehydrogenase
MAPRTTFPRICIALGFETVDTLLRHASEEADNGGSYFEFRLDYLKRPRQGVDAIRTFLTDYPECQVIATCRRKQNNGFFKGSIEEQLRLLEAAVQAGARAVDLEIESAQPAQRSLDQLRSGAKLIVSYHNFSSTPALDGLLKRMHRIPAAAYKIVTTARKPSDISRLLALSKKNSRVPLVVLSMGEIGFPTRVVSPIFGGLYTYAAPATAGGTAAGQICARQLRHLYHVEKLTKSTKIYGVVADPVGHSLSPAVHNRAFQSHRLDAVYLPFLVGPQRLKDFFETARSLPVAGFSVTIPHKQKVMRYLDTIDPLARRIGAVNTVWRKAGKWRGTNTDVAGVTVPLARRVRLAKSSVLVVGSGGAARAAAFALADGGATVSITGRSADAAEVKKLSRVCAAEQILVEKLPGRRFDALVHCTPLGMHPNTQDCFFPDDVPADVVLDMVYNPQETLLLRRAKQQKKQTISGLEMFIEQAVRQFEIWTGASAPRVAMERAAKEALAAQSQPIIKK